MQRLIAPLTITVTHLAMVVLTVVGRDKFASPPTTAGSLLDDIAAFWLWPWLHVAAGLALMLAAAAGPTSRALWYCGWLGSSAVMGSWGWLLLLWGVDTKPGVSLVGPVLAICAAMTTSAVFVERHARFHDDPH